MNCPICREPIENQFLGVRGNVKTCKNFCFENFKTEYPCCPACSIGKMSKTTYHGKEYKQCDNVECNIEISVEKLITLMLKGICK